MDVCRTTLVALTAGLMLAPWSCPAQSMRPESLAQGKIIVTPRDSPDPHFANSVIVLAHYDQTGALGLMIHYKSDLPIQRVFAGIKGAERRSDTLFVGGPVGMPAILALMRSKTPPPGASPVIGNLYLMTSKRSIEATLNEGRPASELRIFIGYAGWGPEQLEREVKRSGWYIFDYDAGTVFDEHPDTLWDRMIQTTERRLAILPRVDGWRNPAQSYR